MLNRLVAIASLLVTASVSIGQITDAPRNYVMVRMGGLDGNPNPYEERSERSGPLAVAVSTPHGSATSASSWGQLGTTSLLTSPNRQGTQTQIAFSYSWADFWDKLTFSNVAHTGQAGTVTYRVSVKGNLECVGGVDVSKGYYGEYSNTAVIALSYGMDAGSHDVYFYRKHGDGTESGADFTNQTLTITEPIVFGNPFHLRLYMRTQAFVRTQYPGHANIHTPSAIFFEGIVSVRNSSGVEVPYVLDSLSGQGWGTPVPRFDLILNKSTVAGQNYVQGNITLDSPASAPIEFTTYDNSSLVSTPPTVTVLAGATTKLFPIQVTAVNSPINTLIYAKRGPITITRPLTLSPLVPTALAFTPSLVTGGGTVACRVVINGVAGPGGRTLAIFDNSAYSTLPSTVLVPAGASQVIFNINTIPVPSQQTVTVTARVSAGEKTATFRINP